MAISAAISSGAAAGTFGGGAAAAPAANAASQFAISIATQAAKRGIDYGAQMAGIGTDAAIEILSPFGAPRWLSYDYTGFVPNLQGLAAAVTSAERGMMGQQQQGTGPSAPGAGSGTGLDIHNTPVTPAAPGTGALPPAPTNPFHTHQSPGAPAAPQVPQQSAGAAGAAGALAPAPPPVPGAGPGGVSLGTPPAPSIPGMPTQQSPFPWDMPGMAHGGGIFDRGGVLPPDSFALNLSKNPEMVLTPHQWADLSSAATRAPLEPATTQGNDFSVRIENLQVKDVDELQRELNTRQRLQMMQHAGRP
jgi:hypothetical protein